MTGCMPTAYVTQLVRGTGRIQMDRSPGVRPARCVPGIWEDLEVRDILVFKSRNAVTAKLPVCVL